MTIGTIQDSMRTVALITRLVLLVIVFTAAIFYLESRNQLPTPTFLRHLSGTGSMYPTFPKGIGTDPVALANQTVTSIPMFRFSKNPNPLEKLISVSEISRGDIINFSNSITNQITTEKYGTPSGFVKRVVGLPNETIEIRDGFVLINNIPLPEAYTLLPHSTFGGKFLPDCKPLTIPENKFIVLGDNRKGSGDSRHDLGFVDIGDIEYILPTQNQISKYDSNYRNTDTDFDPGTRIKLDSQKYLELVNIKRSNEKIAPLKYNSKLEISATLRGEVMLKFNDLSFEATRSGLTQKSAMNKAGYHNIVWGETWNLGYYDQNELFENHFEFPESAKFLLNPDFQDIGISEIYGNLNGCPTQIIVQHLAGYKPPNYDNNYINSWEAVLSQVRSIQPGWESAKQTPRFYSQHKEAIDKITSLISERILLLEQMIQIMRSNRWVPEKNFTKDSSLAKEINSLATKLNSN